MQWKLGRRSLIGAPVVILFNLWAEGEITTPELFAHMAVYVLAVIMLAPSAPLPVTAGVWTIIAGWCIWIVAGRQLLYTWDVNRSSARRKHFSGQFWLEIPATYLRSAS